VFPLKPSSFNLGHCVCNAVPARTTMSHLSEGTFQSLSIHDVICLFLHFSDVQDVLGRRMIYLDEHIVVCDSVKCKHLFQHLAELCIGRCVGVKQK